MIVAIVGCVTGGGTSGSCSSWGNLICTIAPRLASKAFFSPAPIGNVSENPRLPSLAASAFNVLKSNASANPGNAPAALRERAHVRKLRRLGQRDGSGSVVDPRPLEKHFLRSERLHEAVADARICGIVQFEDVDRIGEVPELRSCGRRSRPNNGHRRRRIECAWGRIARAPSRQAPRAVPRQQPASRAPPRQAWCVPSAQRTSTLDARTTRPGFTSAPPNATVQSIGARAARARQANRTRRQRLRGLGA